MTALVIALHAAGVGAGGSSAREGVATNSGERMAPAGADTCTCSSFFREAAHALCPIHGLDALVRGFGEAA